MKKDEKQRKFQQTLLNILYPSPSSRADKEDDDDDDDDDAATIVHDASDLDFVPNDDDSGSSDNVDSPSDASKFESRKLTRAQRKRLRRKKLKQHANSRRRKLIGPQLPSTNDSNEVAAAEQSSGIHELGMRRSDENAAPPPVLDRGIGEPGGTRDCTSQDRLRRRRMAKRSKSKNGEEQFYCGCYYSS